METGEKAENQVLGAGAGDSPQVPRTQVTRDTFNPLGQRAQVDQNTPCSYVSKEKKTSMQPTKVLQVSVSCTQALVGVAQLVGLHSSSIPGQGHMPGFWA